MLCVMLLKLKIWTFLSTSQKVSFDLKHLKVFLEDVNMDACPHGGSPL